MVPRPSSRVLKRAPTSGGNNAATKRHKTHHVPATPAATLAPAASGPSLSVLTQTATISLPASAAPRTIAPGTPQLTPPSESTPVSTPTAPVTETSISRPSQAAISAATLEDGADQDDFVTAVAAAGAGPQPPPPPSAQAITATSAIHIVQPVCDTDLPTWDDALNSYAGFRCERGALTYSFCRGRRSHPVAKAARHFGRIYKAYGSLYASLLMGEWLNAVEARGELDQVALESQ